MITYETIYEVPAGEEVPEYGPYLIGMFISGTGDSEPCR